MPIYIAGEFLPNEYRAFSSLNFLANHIGYLLKPNPPIWSVFVGLVASLLIPLMILAGNNVSNMVLGLPACVILSLAPVNFQHHWNFYMFSFYLELTVLVWGSGLQDYPMACFG